MDHALRTAQQRALQAFATTTNTFALAGGTALELYYLHHRFSADLDFFSPTYDITMIEDMITVLRTQLHTAIQLESEFIAGGRARVRFYTMPVPGSARPLKIDFVEDLLVSQPAVQSMQGVRVYSAADIYMHKIATLTGTQSRTDAVGRPVMEGRHEARDVYDVYMLSQQIQPLHQWLQQHSTLWQKGMIHWYRTFSRQDIMLALLDLDIYDAHFNTRAMIQYLEREIQRFMQGVIDTL